MAQDAAQNPPETDDGKELLSGITTAEQQVMLQKQSEYYNLAQDLPEAQLLEIGQEVKNGYKTDDSSRADWLDMHEFWLRLYMQTDSAETMDAERDWGATESVPILTEACDQFQSRAYKAFFPSETFIEAVPLTHTLDPVKRMMLNERADRIGQHMSWQLGIQNKNYKKDKRSLMLGVAVHGSFFTKTYFDTYKKKRPCIDNVRPTDLVINYNIGPIRIEDCRRKSHIIHTTVGETARLVKSGWLIKPARSDYGDGKTIYDNAVDEADGRQQGNIILRGDELATLVEQQFYLDIDDTGDFLPYLGTIDLSTGQLLRLTIDYDADMNGQPIKDYEQIQYYTHYKFSENPDGFYGLGLGHKIGDLNSAVNIGVRQMLDASTLATSGNCSGFISNRLCQDGEEEVTMTLGKFKKTPDNTGDLQNGIFQFKFPGPNESQMKLIETLDQRAQRLGSTTEATTGSIEKNMQPTTVLAQIEQGMEIFSSVQMGLADSLGDELEKVYRLNKKYLPIVEYFAINDVPAQVTRNDYQDEMTVQPIFDPKFATRAQKVAKAEAEIKATMENPLSQTRPQVYDVAFRRYLQALECENVDELIPPTPLEMIVNAQTAGIPPGIAQPGAAPPQPNPAPPMAQGPSNGMGAGGNKQASPFATGMSTNQNPRSGPNGQLPGGVAGHS